MLAFESGGNKIDIALYADVLRRHRVIVIVGVALTVALAVLSYVRVSPSGVSYRSPEIWSNKATLQLTQEGDPELRSVLSAPSLADTGRFAGLIDVYANLATSDAVVRLLEKRGLLSAKDLKKGGLPITAAAVTSQTGLATPMMTVTASSLTGPKATKLTMAATKAFLDVVRARQLAAKIPAKDRVQIRVVRGSEAPTLVDPRSKALPILVLLGGLIATAAVAFTRENVARRDSVPALTSVASRDEPDSSIDLTDARSAPRPVPHPDSLTAREGAGATIGVTRGRSTLGSVPRAESATARDRNMPDDVAKQSRG